MEPPAAPVVVNEPEHWILPLELVIVQPVDPEPPAIFTLPVVLFPFKLRTPAPLLSISSGAAEAVAVIVGVLPERLIVFSFSVRIPVPVALPMLTFLSLIELTLNKPVPDISSTELLPARLMSGVANVVVPVPATVRLPLSVVVLVPDPMETAEAAPPRFTDAALVLKIAAVPVEVVVIAGELPLIARLLPLNVTAPEPRKLKAGLVEAFPKLIVGEPVVVVILK